MTKILCALDATERAPNVLVSAVEQASNRGARLVLLRVVPPLADIPFVDLGASLNAMTEKMVEGSRAQMEKLAEQVPASMLMGFEVVVGNPWKLICDTARLLDVSLIVMGAHSYSTVDRALGTIASKVINHADRDVLVVRSRHGSGTSA
jgi:nucleotide-binding universal stress UspA family protein